MKKKLHFSFSRAKPEGYKQKLKEQIFPLFAFLLSKSQISIIELLYNSSICRIILFNFVVVEEIQMDEPLDFEFEEPSVVSPIVTKHKK